MHQKCEILYQKKATSCLCPNLALKNHTHQTIIRKRVKTRKKIKKRSKSKMAAYAIKIALTKYNLFKQFVLQIWREFQNKRHQLNKHVFLFNLMDFLSLSASIYIINPRLKKTILVWWQKLRPYRCPLYILIIRSLILVYY